MDWDGLRCLLAISRRETLSAAAKDLGVNQTTVTRRLVRLEEELGVTLVERSPDGITLTDAGREMADASEAMADLVAGAERRVAGRDRVLEGPLRITTIDMVAVYDAELFASFSSRYPEIALEVSVGYATANLTRREADVAIRLTSRPPEHLVGRRVARVAYAPHARRALARRCSREGLAGLPWVGWDRASGAVITARWMARHLPADAVRCRFDSALALHAAIAAGRGVGFMPCVYAARDRRLVRVGPVEPDFTYDAWLLTHRELRSSARVRAFLDHAAAYFDERRAAFAGDQ